MAINLNAVKGLVKFDLSQSEKFMDHHKKLHSKTVAILEQFDNGFYTFLEDNEDMVMVDLGANIGLFSLFMSPLCSEIYALEPTPSHVEIMEELLEKLEVKNIFSHQVAVHTENGEEELQLNSSNSTMNSFLRHGIDPGGTDSVMVPTVKLSDFIKNTVQKRVNFVKMDIEGFENVILHDESFEDAIKEIDALYVEVHDFEGTGKMEENVKKATERLESLGKKVTKLTYDGILAHD
jgi:FkbM family methyltransferase